MALFGSHWNEDDRIPQERGLRAKIPIFEDNWENDWKEIQENVWGTIDNIYKYLIDTNEDEVNDIFSDERVQTCEEYFNNEYFETYEDTYTTPNGEKVVAFGYYGHD